MGHKPLRATSVFSRKRHADCAAIVRRLIDLAADLVTGSTILIAARIAGLNNKVRHDSRNRLAVEISSARQADKVVDSQRRIDREEFDHKRTLVGIDRRAHLFAYV